MSASTPPARSSTPSGHSTPRWATTSKGRPRRPSRAATGAEAGIGASPRQHLALGEARGKGVGAAAAVAGRYNVAKGGRGDGADEDAVPVPLLAEVVDALAALARMRDALRTGLAGSGYVTIPVCDGKRGFDVQE